MKRCLVAVLHDMRAVHAVHACRPMRAPRTCAVLWWHEPSIKRVVWVVAWPSASAEGHPPIPVMLSVEWVPG